MMTANFSLHIGYECDKGQILDAKIANGQYWFVGSPGSKTTRNFFEWLSGAVYNVNNTVELTINGSRIVDTILLKKQMALVRFKANPAESHLYYYQQRYHATENEDITTVSDVIGPIKNEWAKTWIHKLGLHSTLNETINMLSTGEFRKVSILKSVLQQAEIIVIEEPFAGIDAESRILLDTLFREICQAGRAVVVVSAENRENYTYTCAAQLFGTESVTLVTEPNFTFPENTFVNPTSNIVELHNISACYDDRYVLNSITWAIKEHEKWSLTGKNGSGKSTLLSFIYADNPLVYSNAIYVFGKRRGSGESIWDIKDNIGFYSTELHRFFNKELSVLAAIRSILFHNPARKKEFSAENENFKTSLLKWFNLEGKENTPLYQLSVVEQKIVIIIGVLLKNAPILILDEPYQGFEASEMEMTKKIVEKFAMNRTFIIVSHNPSDFPKYVNKHFRLTNGIGKMENNL